MEAVQAQTVDVVQRMKEIKLLMDIPEESLGDCNLSPKDIEGIYLSIYLYMMANVLGFDWFSLVFVVLADVLDELQEHVESIDMANG